VRHPSPSPAQSSLSRLRSVMTTRISRCGTMTLGSTVSAKSSQGDWGRTVSEGSASMTNFCCFKSYCERGVVSSTARLKQGGTGPYSEGELHLAPPVLAVGKVERTKRIRQRFIVAGRKGPEYALIGVGCVGFGGSCRRWRCGRVVLMLALALALALVSKSGGCK
jgi:hypothetical protein